MSNTQSTPNEKPVVNVQPSARKPNDAGTVVIQAHMKIYDPVTKQIYVEGRA